MKRVNWLMLSGLLFMGAAQAASQDVTMDLVSADGAPQAIGHITVSETPYGLLFTPHLTGLPAGFHGFHVHENGSCAAGLSPEGKKVAALAAGGHFDPQHTGKHLGPYGEGHLGDLPALPVSASGVADYEVLAPRLKTLEQIKGRALMVHVGGDNHMDMPMPLGGGGARLACGVI
ncbi:Cu-Zn family superoxide dismutase [Pseudomonas sp. JUb42]|jgi:Cu-Zn family superoxide dismutase|uniref:superoxide dismutase [Cu-Zn] SodC n=1 Tax=Pseudomonas sp. JUb42 TaxID=2940611 RepID=UPI00216AA518|nr:superoxide dismutase [Cu-Zn] SodC [Pseudomonas sp. JUb42]MCS3467015.1 Cu-Zn family superoxide dismutase [Pseudomonas sp. JUb42]